MARNRSDTSRGHLQTSNGALSERVFCLKRNKTKRNGALPRQARDLKRSDKGDRRLTGRCAGNVKPRGGIPCPVLLLFPSSCSVASTTGLQGDRRPAGRVSLTFGRPDGRRHNDRQAQLCAQLQKAGIKAPLVRCVHRARAGSVDRESVFASAERAQLPHELCEVVFPGDGTAALAVAAVAGGAAAVPQVAVARRWKTCCTNIAEKRQSVVLLGLHV